ncbi:MAG: SDR family NAD(P)-dependent oxidoreductase [Candidatus Eremiobacteraeota bacterium]|nr:SDR family NAD(P)-dependent oxidoreductase [Candidatus Eremiobacteraeota bacterium]
MSRELSGRVALVTGGARGIGAAIATALWKRGASVVVADNGTGIDGRGEDENVAHDFVTGLHERAVAFTDDLAEPGAPRHAIELAQSAFGGLDILVNNAAILRDAFVFKAEMDDYEDVLQLNLVAAFEAIRSAAALMREQAKSGRGGERYAWGRIVNVVSTAGFYGNYGQAAYASAKAGLVGLTRVAALDMARTGVAVNAVAPFAATRVTESIVPQNDAQAAYKDEALAVDAAYVGRFVAFLASDAAQRISGQLFGVRGRQTYLFSQPRPVAQFDLEGGSIEDVDAAVRTTFEPLFVPLETDLEAVSAWPQLTPR